MAISYSGSCYAELLRVVETARPEVALGHRLYSAFAQPVANVRGGRTRLFRDVGFFQEQRPTCTKAGRSPSALHLAYSAFCR